MVLNLAAKVRMAAAVRRGGLRLSNPPPLRRSPTHGLHNNKKLLTVRQAPKPALGRAFERYSLLLETRPMATKAATACVLAGLSDLVCQELQIRYEQQAASGSKGLAAVVDELALAEEGWKPCPPQRRIDWARVAKFSMLGVVIAPALHVWYSYMARLLPGTSAGSVVRRVALDQFVFTPPFLVTILSVLQVADGRASQVPDKLKQDFVPTLISNWGVWMPAVALNFRFVPPRFQVLFSNAVGFFWQIYLSHRAFRLVEDAPKDAVAAASGSRGAKTAAAARAAAVAATADARPRR